MVGSGHLLVGYQRESGRDGGDAADADAGVLDIFVLFID